MNYGGWQRASKRGHFGPARRSSASWTRKWCDYEQVGSTYQRAGERERSTARRQRPGASTRRCSSGPNLDRYKIPKGSSRKRLSASLSSYTAQRNPLSPSLPTHPTFEFYSTPPGPRPARSAPIGPNPRTTSPFKSNSNPFISLIRVRMYHDPKQNPIYINFSVPSPTPSGHARGTAPAPHPHSCCVQSNGFQRFRNSSTSCSVRRLPSCTWCGRGGLGA